MALKYRLFKVEGISITVCESYERRDVRTHKRILSKSVRLYLLLCVFRAVSTVSRTGVFNETGNV